MTTLSDREIHIIGGGTVFHVRPHLALTAPAYGTTAKTLHSIILSKLGSDAISRVHLHLTKMAGGTSLETNADIAKLIGQLVADKAPKIIFMNAALCDFNGYILTQSSNLHNHHQDTPSGKDQPRLDSSKIEEMRLRPAAKIIGQIRKERKDIFLVGFKTTAGASPEEQYQKGMLLLKKNSCNLVLANDLHTRNNMVLAPELAAYANTTDRFEALSELVDMTLARASNEFSRTKVVGEEPLPWEKAPQALREVVEYCIKAGAYKPFNGKTVGHFGYRPEPGFLLSSRRKQNYNEPSGLGLAMVHFSPDGVVAYGGKPSAGVRSQYEVLKRHPQFNCIVHFHCPMKDNGSVNVRPQKYFECGSHQCGQNTADGIKLYENDQIGAVMLDKHGPNILFHEKIDPQIVIRFIEKHFDLSKMSR